ncbi:MAG: hypothetical protein EOP88_00120 [Verrucomicrobiaceae bacterium]|nr:MAG: hypothetical protein EOP88_00120 [Verrucomicrobiaceae bacterium]
MKKILTGLSAGLICYLVAGCGKTVTSSSPVVTVTHIRTGPAGSADFRNDSSHTVLVELDGRLRTLRPGDKVTWSGLTGNVPYRFSVTSRRQGSGVLPTSVGQSFIFR